jgi:hypothetical protein
VCYNYYWEGAENEWNAFLISLYAGFGGGSHNSIPSGYCLEDIFFTISNSSLTTGDSALTLSNSSLTTGDSELTLYDSALTHVGPYYIR